MSKDSDRAGSDAAAPEAAAPAATGDPLGLDDDAGNADAPPPPPPAATGRAKSGRGLAGLALLLALGALGGAGYLYYELIHRADARSDTRLDALAATWQARLAETADALDERLAAQAERQQLAVRELAERQQAAQRASEQALREAIAEVSRQAPPSGAEWRQAEVQYLLRIANHRLLLERDVAGALRLLRSANAILAELDDFSLHQVRARLVDEIAALEAVQEVDLPGLFLRLEAAKQGLGELPLRVPEYRRAAAPAPASEAEPTPTGDGAWAALQRQLSGLMRVRRLDGEVKPLLAPEEGVYLELNLRLMLERAQLAAMNREQLVFAESLATAADWVRRYLNVDNAAVQGLLEELAALQSVNLEQPLPDLSGSLNALQQAERAPE